MNRIYSDVSALFKSHPSTSDVTRVFDYNSISQSIKTLLKTRKGERPFSSIDIGSSIYDYLFDLYDPSIINEVKEEVTTLILRYEPRVFVVGVDVNALEEQNAMEIIVRYSFKTSPDRVENISVFFERA